MPGAEERKALEERLKKMEEEAKKVPEGPEKKARVDAAVKALADAKKQRVQVDAEAPAIPNAYAVAEAKPANAKGHMRGDPKRHAGPDHAGQKLRLAEALRAHAETPRANTTPANLRRM